MTRAEAQAFIASIIAIRETASDEQASTAVAIYPTLKEENELIPVGTRINWNGVLKRAAVDVWDTPGNNPDNAPDLWEDIAYREGYRIIPETITVGTAFAKDECGWWDDVLYKSLMDANVYTPEQYPTGWEIVDTETNETI